MLFNLRKAAGLGVNEGTSVRVPLGTISGIDFAEPANPRRLGLYFSNMALANFLPSSALRRLSAVPAVTREQMQTGQKKPRNR